MAKQYQLPFQVCGFYDRGASGFVDEEELEPLRT